jgi:hypothetical protein
MAELHKCQGIVKSGHPCCNKMKYKFDGTDKNFCWKHLAQESAITIPAITNSVYLDDNDCMDDESFQSLLEYLASSSVSTPPPPPPPPPPTLCPVEDCSICMEKMSSSTFVVTACAHKFHPDCLDKWVEVGHTTCPLCRNGL